MTNYYGEKSSFLAKVVAAAIIIVSFILMILYFPTSEKYTVGSYTGETTKGSWLLSFGILLSGLFSSSILLLLEAILRNVSKPSEQKKSDFWKI